MVSKVFIGRYKSKDVIYSSSSGGAFTVLYEYAIANNYSVYGVRFNKDFKVEHSRATTLEECEEFRKSKYVLSDMKFVYRQVAQDLYRGKSVLFSGTPCQCSALMNYLLLKCIDMKKLLLVDLICHGAPSQKIFDEYRIENQKQIGDSWLKFNFRAKHPKKGIVNSRNSEIYYKSGGFLLRTIENDPFLKGYYNRLFYRKSCAACPFANSNRLTDITIGDAWGIENIKPEWNPITGVSLIILNNEKGMSLLSNFENKMDLIESNIEWAIENNSQLKKPTIMHINREKFFCLLPRVGFQKAVEKSMKMYFYYKIINKIKSLIRMVKKL